jgi:hypothetical protein
MLEWDGDKFMAMQFAIRIERENLAGYAMVMAELINGECVFWEEWDTLKLAEQRATTLRKQGARVEVYRLL